MRRLLVVLSVLVATSAWAGKPARFGELSTARQQARLAADAQALLRYRAGLARVVQLTRLHPELFPATKLAAPRLLQREQREAVWATWQSFLEYVMAADSLAEYYADFPALSSAVEGGALAVRYGSFLAPYRFALDFIDRAENDPGLTVILDEPVPELGLAGGSYAAVKLRFLNIQRAAEFAAFEALRARTPLNRFPALRAAVEEDAAAVWQAGKGRGEQLTAANALAVVKGTTSSAFFPVQAGIAEWMGDTKVWRTERNLISDAQIQSLAPRLLPGDILLERREWYLSNIGLPGYWPHAALVVGTPEERAALFADPEVTAWVKAQGQPDGDFEALLAAREPAAAKTSRAMENGHPVRVLEAISEGVVFTSFEHTLAADSLAVLRPRLATTARAAAILRAFHYAGRPYDYDFDFLTDSALVCTELVYKAYEPGPGKTGLSLPLTEVLGRTTLPPNLIARMYDEELRTVGQQLDLVAFLDGDEAVGVALESTEASFRASWKRPKWHVVVR
jgi:hypothetical protein